MSRFVLVHPGFVALRRMERMAAAADHVVRLPSAHQPMLSMPGALAELLGRVAATD